MAEKSTGANGGALAMLKELLDQSVAAGRETGVTNSARWQQERRNHGDRLACIMRMDRGPLVASNAWEVSRTHGRKDLTVEAIVLAVERRFPGFFPAPTVQKAQRRHGLM
jgi:hypothetical protein